MEKKLNLEYIDLKNSIRQSEEEIEKCQKVIAISEIALEAFKKEIKKYPKPDQSKLNTTMCG